MNYLSKLFSKKKSSKNAITKKIICLCGVSGSGKTWERLNNPELSSLPYVDISDIYRKLKTSDYVIAWEGFIQEIKKEIQKNNSVVIEAAFTWRQREKIKFFAELNNITVEFIYMPHVDKKILLDRVLKDYENTKKTIQDTIYYNARVSMINNLGQ